MSDSANNVSVRIDLAASTFAALSKLAAERGVDLREFIVAALRYALGSISA